MAKKGTGSWLRIGRLSGVERFVVSQGKKSAVTRIRGIGESPRYGQSSKGIRIPRETIDRVGGGIETTTFMPSFRREARELFKQRAAKPKASWTGAYVGTSHLTSGHAFPSRVNRSYPSRTEQRARVRADEFDLFAKLAGAHASKGAAMHASLPVMKRWQPTRPETKEERKTRHWQEHWAKQGYQQENKQEEKEDFHFGSVRPRTYVPKKRPLLYASEEEFPTPNWFDKGRNEKSYLDKIAAQHKVHHFNMKDKEEAVREGQILWAQRMKTNPLGIGERSVHEQGAENVALRKEMRQLESLPKRAATSNLYINERMPKKTIVRRGEGDDESPDFEPKYAPSKSRISDAEMAKWLGEKRRNTNKDDSRLEYIDTSRQKEREEHNAELRRTYIPRKTTLTIQPPRQLLTPIKVKESEPIEEEKTIDEPTVAFKDMSLVKKAQE